MMQTIRGSNPSSIKDANRRAVLKLIREGNATRTSLAEATGLTRGGLSPIIAELLDEELIIEKEPVAIAHGRPQVKLKLNGQYVKLISIQWVRDMLSVALMGIDGSLQSSWHYAIRGDESSEEMMEMMIAQIKALIKQAADNLLIGIIAQVPGPLDTRGGVILKPSYFNGWHDIPLGERLRTHFDLPVIVENNLVGYTLAERHLGHGREHDCFISLLVDEGIGAGLIVDGHLYQGQSGQIAEIGHITLNVNGPQCSCGNYGCAELYCNVPSMCRIAFGDDCNQKGRSWVKPMKALAEGCKRSDVNCLRAIEHESKYLGSLIINLINVFDVSTVVIGGALTYAGEYLKDPLLQYITPRIAAKGLLDPVIHFSQVDNASLVGGAYRLFDCYLKGELDSI